MIKRLLLCGWLLAGVAGVEAQGPALEAGAAKATTSIRLEDATAASGIAFAHSMGSAKLSSLLEATGAGCAWFDYNNDGFPDVYVVNGRPLDDSMHPFPLREKPATTTHNHLYRNNGDGSFTDVTEGSGAVPDFYGFAVTAGDFDNDGFVDLLVAGYGHVALYRNLGNGTFADVTAKSGIAFEGWGISSTWLDYDRDGCLDLFVGRYVKFDPKYRSFYPADNYPGPLDYEPTANALFHSNCNGTFTDVTAKSGIGALLGRTMGVTAADFDDDGWTDIYVANDKTENFLFRNKHDGTFAEVAVEAEVAYGQNGENTGSMGPVFADITGAGRLDLWVTDSKYNRFLRNDGHGRFQDIGAETEISRGNAQYASWGSGVYDFDNDGWRDVLIFHGGLIQMVPEEHSLFRNRGAGRFEDVSTDAGPVLDEKTVARGACFADYLNTGRMGALLVNLNAPALLMKNVTVNANHWLGIALRGTVSNRDGLGARVTVIAGDRSQMAERVAASGYLSQDDGRLHFGLGTAAKADEVRVRWPSGREQTLKDVAVDRILQIEEPR